MRRGYATSSRNLRQTLAQVRALGSGYKSNHVQYGQCACRTIWALVTKLNDFKTFGGKFHCVLCGGHFLIVFMLNTVVRCEPSGKSYRRRLSWKLKASTARLKQDSCC